MGQKVRWAGYVRVSDQKQIEGYSLAAQQRAIEKFVDERGGGPIKWYIDAGISGTATDKRDAFLEMRRDAGAGEWDVLVCHKFDRLARDRFDAVTVKMLLRREYGVKVMSVEEGGEDVSGPQGMLMESMLEAVAAWYSVNLGGEVKKVRDVMLTEGRWYGNRPFGYMNGDDGLLVPHPVEAPQLQSLFAKYLEPGVSLYDLSVWATEQGYRTTRGHTFGKTGLAQILNNRVYLGELRHNDTEYDRTNGKKRRVHPRYNDYNWHKGKHEPLISQETFDAVQTKRRRSINNTKLVGSPGNYLLSGLVYCADCIDENVVIYGDESRRGRMRGRKYNQRNKLNYYACQHRPSHPWAQMDKINKQVLDFLLSDNLPTEWKDNAVHVVARSLDSKRAEERIADITNILKQMEWRWDTGLMTDQDTFTEQYKALQTEIDALQPLVDDSITQAWRFVNNFRTEWERSRDVEDQQKLIRMLIERVYVRNGCLESVVLKPDYRFVFV